MCQWQFEMVVSKILHITTEATLVVLITNRGSCLPHYLVNAVVTSNVMKKITQCYEALDSVESSVKASFCNL